MLPLCRYCGHFFQLQRGTGHWSGGQYGQLGPDQGGERPFKYMMPSEWAVLGFDISDVRIIGGSGLWADSQTNDASIV